MKAEMIRRAREHLDNGLYFVAYTDLYTAAIFYGLTYMDMLAEFTPRERLLMIRAAKERGSYVGPIC